MSVRATQTRPQLMILKTRLFRLYLKRFLFESGEVRTGLV